MIVLTKNELEILRAFSKNSNGLLTSEIAKEVTYCAHNNRMRSAAVRSWLNRMKTEGLVDCLDIQGSPTCWVRTRFGAEILPAAGGEK